MLTNNYVIRFVINGKVSETMHTTNTCFRPFLHEDKEISF